MRTKTNLVLRAESANLPSSYYMDISIYQDNSFAQDEIEKAILDLPGELENNFVEDRIGEVIFRLWFPQGSQSKY